MQFGLDQGALLADLTDAQREAVTCTRGPLLVLAAAGSGKTRVITRRIAYLVAQGEPPWSILALTFTNKAAGEMRRRVESLLGASPGALRGLTVTTFHALGARLLRRHADAVPGLRPDFTIYDAGDQGALMKKVIGDLGLSSSNWPAAGVLARVSQAKNQLLDAAAFAEHAGDFSSRSVARIYAAYERALRAANAVDFDDLLMRTAELLRASEEVRSALRARWRHLLIDEYQDTNRAQFLIAALLAGDLPPRDSDAAAGDPGVPAPRAEPDPRPGDAPGAPGGIGPNICVVGDPDQAIYAWRGADISNILDFESCYPGARVVRLGENFRSTAPILAAADRLIRHNVRRKHKDLFTSRPGGAAVEVLHCLDEQDEARRVVDWLRARRSDGDADAAPVEWKDMAVLYRTNALSRVAEDALRSASIPYVIARGTAFYQREEVKNALAYLRLAANPADSASLLRVINTPPRGLGETTVARLEALAASRGTDLFAALLDPEPGSLPARTARAARAFAQMVEGWRSAGAGMPRNTRGTLADLVERVIKESGLEAMYRARAHASASEADIERPDNLAELVSSARQYELEHAEEPDAQDRDAAAGAAPDEPGVLRLLLGYLESVALLADADLVDPDRGAVTLMTLHAAKGLEFAAVAIIGLEEGLLPHARSRENDAALEEERRLCFVGMTRAMRSLLLTCARYRTIRGIPERTIPSQFLAQLQGPQVVVTDTAGDIGAWSRPAPVREGPSRRFEPDADSSRGPGLPVGARVRHPQFGVGEVLDVTGGANARARINFRGVGVKTLVLEYARLEVVR